MSDETKPNGEEQIATLLRLAGRRPQVPEDVAARVRGAVQDEWRGVVAGRRRRTVWRWGAAAALAILVVIAARLPFRRATVTRSAQPPLVASIDILKGTATIDGRPLAMTDAIRIAATIETTSRSTLALDWNRRASLRLAPDSRVRFVDRDSVAIERGALYVSSRPGQHASIIVMTNRGVVRDIGTQFEVRVSPESVRLRVREGIVNLGSERAEVGKEITATGSGIARRDIPTSGAEWSWIDELAPPIVASGGVREILASIAREKGLRLAYSAPDASLHGNVALSPDEALDAVTAAAGLRRRIDGDTLIVEARR